MELMEVERCMLKLAAATIAPIAQRLCVVADLPADVGNPLDQIVLAEDQLNAARNLLLSVKVGIQLRAERDKLAKTAETAAASPPAPQRGD